MKDSHQVRRSQVARGHGPLTLIHVLKRPVLVEISWKVFRISSFWIRFREDTIKSRSLGSSLNNPVDTRRKLNVHKTFKRHPGRLLNVLCTLNLRPVSTG